MGDAIVRYFSLERPVFGAATGVRRELYLFSGVLAGSVGQWLFAFAQTGKPEWATLVLGVIASFVTFPVIFHNAGLDEAQTKFKMTFVKWCVAFQNGFFWPSLMQQVARGFPAAGGG